MSAPPAVDRPARDRLADLTRRFLDGELWAFAYDEAVHEVWDETDDPTVERVAALVWYHYDDCTDHPAALSREQWDYFQRLLLILESDGRLEETTRRRWRTSQAVAAAGLAVTAVVGWGIFEAVGFGEGLLVACVPGFAASVAAYALNRNADRRLHESRRVALDPLRERRPVRFGWKTWRRSGTRRRGFGNGGNPREVGERRIRGAASELLSWVHVSCSWFVAAPLVLLAQTLPHTETRHGVRLP